VHEIEFHVDALKRPSKKMRPDVDHGASDLFARKFPMLCPVDRLRGRVDVNEASQAASKFERAGGRKGGTLGLRMRHFPVVFLAVSAVLNIIICFELNSLFLKPAKPQVVIRVLYSRKS
jgi:hypothetical protein